MDTIEIISKYYKKDSLAYNILLEHSRMVTQKALEIANRVKHLKPDELFIEEAAMLHDIGIFLTNEPGIGCYGNKEYICHGYLGRELLENEDMPKHALVCERHIGIGFSIKDIQQQNLPLPRRDMMPVSVEEKIICLADKFFSKKKNSLHREISLDEVRQKIKKYGSDKLREFDRLTALFNIR